MLSINLPDSKFLKNGCSLIDRHARDYYMIAIDLFIKLNSSILKYSEKRSTLLSFPCTTGTHKRLISQECLHHFEKNKSNCIQLTISIDA
ncbi:hypothetical protein T07_2973 [Trichinella nelsoni]|uniref:Uncharacterized protein n=1 Tax=Trichinella nelsoni TaxID=6336 RepID=A0A0V0SLR6_9BILA|nr:hypothetical protein T07_2973 [Trichinella nelsoni]